MRIDLPSCDLKNCKYCQDGNCVNTDQFKNCYYTIAKAVTDKALIQKGWNRNSNPPKEGTYLVLLYAQWSGQVYIVGRPWNGEKFEVEEKNIVLGWKKLGTKDRESVCNFIAKHDTDIMYAVKNKDMTMLEDIFAEYTSD